MKHTAILTGGNFLGCSSYTAANVLRRWFENQSGAVKMVLVLDAEYNFGCHDPRGTESTVGGQLMTAQQCFKRLALSPADWMAYVKAYWLKLVIPGSVQSSGYLAQAGRHYQTPEAEDRASDAVLRTYTVQVYRNEKPVGIIGEGPRVIQLDFTDSLTPNSLRDIDAL